MSNFTLSLFYLLIFFTLTGCNTAKGIGKDVEAGGKAIQRSTEPNEERDNLNKIVNEDVQRDL